MIALLIKKRPTYVRDVLASRSVLALFIAFYIAFVCFLGMSGNIAVSSYFCVISA